MKTLRNGTVLATHDEIDAAALQFVRKVSGFQRPAEHNRDVFDTAVGEVAQAARRLLDGLVIGGTPTSRPPTA
ncbi:MAG: DUF2277 family protein [Gemmatimonadales bacterium]|nr:DUF2277 family protein [Gemmatimonadales bacterium]